MTGRAPLLPFPIDETLSWSISQRTKQSLAMAMKKSDFSRAQIAERLSAMLGREIKEKQLIQWAAESEVAYRAPYEVIIAVSMILRDASILEVGVQAIGKHIVGDAEMSVLELAELDQEQARLQAAQERIEQRKIELRKRLQQEEK